jgi:hypothetical protein
MTNDTTATTPEEQLKEQPEEAVLARVTLAYLLESVERYVRVDFEEWALDFYNEAHRRLARARTRLWTMERLGLPVETMAPERAKVTLWEAQMIQAQLLSAANPEDAALDYSDPKVLRYYALWLWDTDHCKGERPDPSPYTYGPLDWALYLDDELLNLPSFGLR